MPRPHERARTTSGKGRHNALPLEKRQSAILLLLEILGGTRKVNGARLGFARNARTGAITRFTVRGIKVALNSLAREMVNEMGREDDRR